MTEVINQAAGGSLERAKWLIDTLSEANEIYNQGNGDSPLTDAEFDSFLEELEDLSSQDALAELFEPGTQGYLLLGNDPALGATVDADAGETVRHLAPMMSLAKAKNEAEVKAWVKRMEASGVENYKLQAKLDGFALSAVYKGGKLQHLATRGDGLVGENVSYLLSDPNATVLGLPKLTEEKGEFEVRGEVFFTDEQFEKVKESRFKASGETFKNSRNAVVGLMKKAKSGLAYPVEFTYCTYSMYKGGELQNLEAEIHPGFITVQQITEEQTPGLSLTDFSNVEELFSAVEEFGRMRQHFTIPTDGVVIKPTNENFMHGALGATSHHPVSQIAYKYPGETRITKVVNIVSTVGKTGKITPVAEIEPVTINENTLQFFTCSNYNWLVSQKDIRVGSTVKVGYAMDVIPEIKHVVANPSDSVPTEAPTTCPSCGSRLSASGDGIPAPTLRCVSENCPEKVVSGIIASVGKTYLDIDGLSSSVIKNLYNIGRINDIGDLYTLSANELQDYVFGFNKKSGKEIKVGQKRAENIVKHLELSKSHPLPRLLASLNVEGLGRTMSKRIVKVYLTLGEIRALSADDLVKVNGIQVVTAEKIVSGLAAKASLIDKMLENGVKFGEAPEASEGAEASAGGATLSGLSFSISGAVPEAFSNRSALVDYIEANGGEFHSSPKKDTSFMIGDPSDGSSKIKKALSLGLEIVTPQEFGERFLGN